MIPVSSHTDNPAPDKFRGGFFRLCKQYSIPHCCGILWKIFDTPRQSPDLSTSYLKCSVEKPVENVENSC